jgi:hypothetical protein
MSNKQRLSLQEQLKRLFKREEKVSYYRDDGLYINCYGRYNHIQKQIIRIRELIKNASIRTV